MIDKESDQRPLEALSKKKEKHEHLSLAWETAMRKCRGIQRIVTDRKSLSVRSLFL